MLKCLSKFYSLGTHTKKKPINKPLKPNNQISDTKQYQYGIISSKLTKLFSNPYHLILLAKTFRIFTFYFKKEIVVSMLQSNYMKQYIQYLLNQDHIDNMKNEHLRQILLKVQLVTRQQQKILQIYINYLKRTADLTTNDSIMQGLDLQHPQHWFQTGQVPQRKYIYHHGPTNSGKTFFAINQLKKLKTNQKGIYMAPLRLLAWQTQKKLGKCNLITGQQKDYQNSHLTSCTIQTAQLQKIYDVAIIDQIQLLGSMQRGWAWTSAILGIKASFIHLCGDQRALYLVSKLVQKVGGTLEQRDYSRLSKLHVMKTNFKFINISPGDCLISFDIESLYKYRKIINQVKGTSQHPLTTAIVYGKLPPQCRKVQASKFNNGQLPYLVSTDAIGMGLNLNIKKVVFLSIRKKAQTGQQRQLTDVQIRQIAGRAGRGYSQGYVQCATDHIFQRVKHALKGVNITYDQKLQDEKNSNNKQLDEIIFSQQKQQQNKKYQSQYLIDQQLYYDPLLKRQLKYNQMEIKKACISFPINLIQRTYVRMEKIFKTKPTFMEIFNVIKLLSMQNQQLYFIQKNMSKTVLSQKLQHLKLPVQTHNIFTNCPVFRKDHENIQIIVQFARQYKQQGIVKIPQQIIKNYEDNYKQLKNGNTIQKLQYQFCRLESYTWLWNQFQFYFPYYTLANNIKQSICNKINQLLNSKEYLINIQQNNYQNYYKNQFKSTNHFKRHSSYQNKRISFH